jgi:predicted nucleic-acid-binding protein
MIGLDTNVLVRFIAQDDEKQSPIATALIEKLNAETPGYVTLVSLVELVWVMQSCYDCKKSEIVDILNKLLRTQELIIENAETAFKALILFSKSKADFADCLIERSANSAGCMHTVTFDEKSAKTAGMRHLV